jgi:predicted SnoaL-like aldol condensation-catalyzing enzyme
LDARLLRSAGKGSNPGALSSHHDRLWDFHGCKRAEPYRGSEVVPASSLVFVAAKGTHEGDLCGYIDLYRVENLKVVEHWGFPQMVAPQSEWKNSNGML